MSKQRNVFVRATPTRSVKGGAIGRIEYITSEQAQEHLEAVHHSTDDPMFWQDLQQHCERAAREAGKAVYEDGREHFAKLDNQLVEMYHPQVLCEKISDFYKEKTGTENVTSLQWNIQKRSLHYHTVFAENPEINEVHYGAVLRQNTYYNAEGQRCNKRDAIDPETKELKDGYTMLKKGERKATVKRFGAKDSKLSSKTFLMNMKQDFAKFMNELMGVELFKVFKDDGLHIPQQYVGNRVVGEVKAQIEARNKLIQKYNNYVDNILDLAKELNLERPEVYEKWENNLKDHRTGLKKVVKAKGPEAWEKTIIQCLNGFERYLAFLKDEMDKRKRKALKTPEMAQNEPNTTTTRAVDDILADIATRKGVDVPSKQPFRTKAKSDPVR